MAHVKAHVLGLTHVLYRDTINFNLGEKMKQRIYMNTVAHLSGQNWVVTTKDSNIIIGTIKKGVSSYCLRKIASLYYMGFSVGEMCYDQTAPRNVLLNMEAVTPVNVSVSEIEKSLSFNNYSTDNSVNVMERGRQIVAYIPCGKDKRFAVSEAKKLAEVIVDHYPEIELMVSAVDHGIRWWAEVIIVTNPLSPEDCSSHNLTIYETSDNDVYAYFDPVNNEWVVMVTEVEFMRVHHAYPTDEIITLVNWFENGVQAGIDFAKRKKK